MNRGDTLVGKILGEYENKDALKSFSICSRAHRRTDSTASF